MQSRPIARALNVGALTQGQEHASELKIKLEAKHFNFYYGAFQALDDISLAMRERSITAIIGPSGCGKSTLLRAINRMHDQTPGARGQGELLLDGQNIYGAATDPVLLRRRVGMVFQRPNAFAKSIFDNVAYGLKILGWRDRAQIAERVEQVLRQAALWDEVKDRLTHSGLRVVGRAAAAAVHCAGDRAAAGCAADGRAVLGARPDRHAEDRGADAGAAARVYDRDRDAQHAAGGARIG